ncbi:hypothetical protein NE237_031768 [Protea cynaroides]|uniref:U-box domain-containing protein n=1 Tax=Protea cynaroides TaxID=273540 RepID=A0A9Q0L317_9MAGN|nr:hypothetical protein NE237_031768 [Protea cynaroides]
MTYWGERLESESGDESKTMVRLEVGAVEFLASIVTNESSDSASDEALYILYHLQISESGLKNLTNRNGDFIQTLMRVLQHGSYPSRAYALLLLKCMFKLADPIYLMSLRLEHFVQIVNILRDQISQPQSLKFFSPIEIDSTFKEEEKKKTREEWKKRRKEVPGELQHQTLTMENLTADRRWRRRPEYMYLCFEKGVEALDGCGSPLEWDQAIEVLRMKLNEVQPVLFLREHLLLHWCCLIYTR